MSGYSELRQGPGHHFIHRISHARCEPTASEGAATTSSMLLYAGRCSQRNAEGSTQNRPGHTLWP